MYGFHTHKLNVLKQMSNTLAAANVTAECLRKECDEEARRKEETRDD